jgi:hypothetical protein
VRAHKRQRQTATLAARADPGSHQFQGIEHPAHRPSPQRGVAIENYRYRATGHGPHHQPAAGAGIAEIERSLRLCEAGHADAVDGPGEIAGAFHLRAQRLHGLGGIEDVFALQEARNPGLSDRQRAQNQGTVRNRLVTGDADLAGQRPACASFERACLVRMGQDCVLCAGGRYHMGRAASR